MGLEEPSDFEQLLGELERAAEEIGSLRAELTTGVPALTVDGTPPSEAAGATLRDEDWGSTMADQSTPFLSGVQMLNEAPSSLVDLRALTMGEPLSHVMTQPIDRSVQLGPGVVIDHKYEVLGRAEGSRNAWEVRHVVLRQKFHVQLLARSIVDDPVMWPKFQHDIRAAGMLGHEHIEFVTDLGRCEQYGAYIVKQFIEGPTLEQWLEKTGPRTPREAVTFTHSIGEALAALHEIGIIHGRLSPRSVRRVDTADGPVWKLLDVCIPGVTDTFLAPEQSRGDATGPEADQYALAFLTWTMLVGPGGTLDDDPDVPIEMRAVLRTALDDVPQQRWPDVDSFIAELSRSSPMEPQPSIHPFDRREASRVIEQELREKSEVEDQPPPQGFESQQRPRSMSIDILLGDAPAVHVQFNTGARLRRAYRRNMLAGGLFVPTSGDLPMGELVHVSLTFMPKAATLHVEGLVVTHDPGTPARPRGYGVAFEVGARQKIEKFVRELNLGLGIAPDDELHIRRQLDEDSVLEAGAAFLLSRLTNAMPVGAARAMFAALPYDFDECLSELIDKEYLEVRPPAELTRHRPTPRYGMPSVTEASKLDTRAEPRPPRPARERMFNPPQTARPPDAHLHNPPETKRPSKPSQALANTAQPRQQQPRPQPQQQQQPVQQAQPQQPRQHERRPTDEEGPSTKRRSTQRVRTRPRTLRDHEWNDVARVIESVQYFEEQGNFLAASRVLTSATENAPEVAVFHHQLAMLKARFEMDILGAREAIRRARSIEPNNEEFEGAERYIATLVELSAVRVLWERPVVSSTRWLRTEPSLEMIWFEERGMEQVVLHTVKFDGTSEQAVRPAGWRAVPQNDPEFDVLERRKPQPIASGRERRERQIELGRRFGGFGPHFVKEPLGATRTVNSTLTCTTRDGLRVFRDGTQLSHLSHNQARNPVFSYNDQSIAWAEEAEDGWRLHVAPITGPGDLRATLEGKPRFFWTDDSAGLVVHDTRSNNVLFVDKRIGEPRLLYAPRASVDVLVCDSCDDDSILVVAKQVVGRARWYCAWVDVRTSEIRGEYVLPAGARAGIVRSDGRIALQLHDGRLLVADLRRKIVKPLTTCTPDPASLTNTCWAIGAPLVVAELAGKTARVVAIDVEMLTS